MLLLLAPLAVGCDSSGSTRGKTSAPDTRSETPTAPRPQDSGARLSIDPIIGRWVLDERASASGRDSESNPEEMIGRTIILSRDGTLLATDSGRRGSWRRATGGVRIVVDPPPRLFDALLECTVTDHELRFSGPRGLRLIYHRDSLMAPTPRSGG